MNFNDDTVRDWWLVTRRRCSRVGFALTAMLLVWVGLQLAVAGVLRFQGIDSNGLPTWLQLAMGNGPLYVLAMPLAVLMMHSVPVVPTRRFNLGFGRFVAILLICLPIMYTGSIVGSLLSGVLSQNSAQNPIAELASSSDPWSAAVLMVLVAPVFEEWIFRKQLIDRLRRYGEVPAALISALAFGLFHLNLFQFFYAFGLGLVFAYVYLRTSRLRYSIIMHMIINLNGGVIAPHVLSLVDTKTLEQLQSGSLQGNEQLIEQSGAEIITLGVYGMVMIALIIAGIVLLITNRRRVEWYQAPEELPRGTRLRTTMANPGMITYVVVCLVVMGITLFVS